MKNRFIITEEEKNRILGMHKFATSRQYLSEQKDNQKIKIFYRKDDAKNVDGQRTNTIEAYNFKIEGDSLVFGYKTLGYKPVKELFGKRGGTYASDSDTTLSGVTPEGEEWYSFKEDYLTKGNGRFYCDSKSNSITLGNVEVGEEGKIDSRDYYISKAANDLLQAKCNQDVAMNTSSAGTSV